MGVFRGRVLVTGADGFVGMHLVPALLRRGCSVIGLGRRKAGPTGVSDWLTADVRDSAAVRAAVARATPDAVIHLAGITHLPRVIAEPAEAFAVNVIGTRNVLDAVSAGAPRARMLLISSAAVYGTPAAADLPLREDAPQRAEHPYGVQKIAIECLGERARRDAGVQVVIARPFNHLGAGQEARFAASWFASQIARIEASLMPPVMRVGNLEPRRDLLDVADVIRAYLALLDLERFEGLFNVCRGTSTRIGDVLELLLRQSRKPILVEDAPELHRPHDAPDLVGSAERLASATGWRPEIPLEATLTVILESARNAVAGPGAAPERT